MGLADSVLFGVLVGPAGIYIRNHLEDATPPPAAKQDSPIRQVFLHQKLRVILGIGALAVSTAVNYLIVFMPTYVVKTLNLPPIVGYEATLAGALIVTLLTPISGMISDRIGRTTHMIAVNLLLLFSITPTFLLLTRNPTPAIIIMGVSWLAMLKSLYFGPLAALMSELLPADDPRHRPRSRLQYRRHGVRRHGAGDHDLAWHHRLYRRSFAGLLPDMIGFLEPGCTDTPSEERPPTRKGRDGVAQPAFLCRNQG